MGRSNVDSMVGSPSTFLIAPVRGLLHDEFAGFLFRGSTASAIRTLFTSCGQVCRSRPSAICWVTAVRRAPASILRLATDDLREVALSFPASASVPPAQENAR